MLCEHITLYIKHRGLSLSLVSFFHILHHGISFLYVIFFPFCIYYHGITEGGRGCSRNMGGRTREEEDGDPFFKENFSSGTPDFACEFFFRDVTFVRT